MKTISADGEIEEIEANEKVLAISSTSTISLYCADTLKIIYTIKDSLVPGRVSKIAIYGSFGALYSITPLLNMIINFCNFRNKLFITKW